MRASSFTNNRQMINSLLKKLRLKVKKNIFRFHVKDIMTTFQKESLK